MRTSRKKLHQRKIQASDMLKAYILGSSSEGNAYILRFEGGGQPPRQILVEAGFSYSALVDRAMRQGALMSECTACLVTHCHGDHADGARAVNNKGIPVFASRETLTDKNVGIEPTSRNVLRHWEPKYITKGIQVLPFLVEHDAPSPMGFVIRDMATKENVLFINDCKTVRADLSTMVMDHVFIECNYYDPTVKAQFLQAKQDQDRLAVKRYLRIMRQHMSLYGCRKLLQKLRLGCCQGIWLMHLSDANSHERLMRSALLGDFRNIPIHICRKDGGYN